MGLWFVFCVFSLSISLLSLVYISKERIVTPSSQSFRLYAALPSSSIETVDEIVRQDARIIILENFLNKHKSPLARQSALLIKVAEENNLDFRLFSALVYNESQSSRTMSKDSSSEEATKNLGKRLKTEFIDEGLTTPREMMPKYLSNQKSKQDSWADTITRYIKEMQ